jgi:bifunctional DNase/RNase
MPAITDTGFVPMRVSKVTAMGLAGGDDVSYYVVLDEPEGDLRLVILIGPEEAFDLASTLAGKQWPRPRTYQLMAALVRALDGRVREVRLDRVVDGAYAATVEVEGPAGAARGVDARSSDALNLAVLLGVPVFVAPVTLDDCARRLAGDSPEAVLARRALTAHPITFVRSDELAAEAVRPVNGRNGGYQYRGWPGMVSRSARSRSRSSWSTMSSAAARAWSVCSRVRSASPATALARASAS